MAATMPPAGAEAPDFELRDQRGEVVRLRDFRGRWVVLYFYPKDDTPGCTKEACSFRDHHSGLEAAGAVVLGVSGDSEQSHQKFADKYSLPFTLLQDPGHHVAKAYGAWGTKNRYGRTHEGILRSTFLIAPSGSIAHVWPRVRPERHAEEVLGWLRKQQSN
jgi:peroxiredoxin Q/BCP